MFLSPNLFNPNLGPILAQRLNCAFAPVRKAGKLPGNTIRVGYEKEYGMV